MKAQKWPACSAALRAFINQFICLVTEKLGAETVVGIYLHGSLATGSYYAPKSDIDIIVVVADKLDAMCAQKLNRDIALLAERRPTVGSLECSVITASVAKAVPVPMPYELHYSADWHDRILRGEVTYGAPQTDIDLQAHVFCLKKRGVCLFGAPIDAVFGEVQWTDFVDAVVADLQEILAEEYILKSPYYSVLNICRVFQLFAEGRQYPYTKDEGGAWGLQYFPYVYRPLIEKALTVYHAKTPVTEEERKTGGVLWDEALLLSFRDYARRGIQAFLV